MDENELREGEAQDNSAQGEGLHLCPHCKTVYKELNDTQTIIAVGRELLPETELEEKVREFYELLLARYEPLDRELGVKHCMENGIARGKMRKFYAEHGRWPEFKPAGPMGGVAMEGIE